MADQASASTSSTAAPGEITVNVKCPADVQPNKLSVSISPDKTVIDLKEAIAEKCDLPKERQKLIFSGKVLKDDDVLSTYKMQTGHTLHLLRTNKPPETPAAAAQVPRLPQMGTGLNVASDPIDGITNVHHGLAGFNPFANMQGLDNLNDPNAMTGLMNNPDFLRHVADTMQQPGMIDQIINSNPQLASMGPQLRATLQSPMFREIMSNPEALRSMMQMQQAMGGAGGMGGLGGMGGMGGMGGLGGFPGMGGMFGQPSGGAGAGQANRAAQPGQTPTSEFPNLFAPNAGQTATPSTGAQTGAAAGQTGAQQPNPFAALMGGMGNFGGADGTGIGAGAGAGAGAGTAGAGAGAGQQPNPFAALLGSNPFLGNPGLFGGAGFAPPPQDTRPPEEIYATQLGQLNAMGLWDAQKNIRALRSTGGNVEAAIELIFSGQLDGTG